MIYCLLCQSWCKKLQGTPIVASALLRKSYLLSLCGSLPAWHLGKWNKKGGLTNAVLTTPSLTYPVLGRHCLSGWAAQSLTDPPAFHLLPLRGMRQTCCVGSAPWRPESPCWQTRRTSASGLLQQPGSQLTPWSSQRRHTPAAGQTPVAAKVKCAEQRCNELLHGTERIQLQHGWLSVLLLA